ncbi:SDR family NAD(P)-dependent oxidoreductase [Cecembia rubra]|uniref:Short-subunit dehydrogenase n=1 Tax=Cecembia rubra TaxID=1485585 RepID=A0A2P8DXR8_9BACT|nr:SDR family NAD(P)-dependent oxidoreductase [Cecembia rubra]PSL02018.1 short-subunit dehydrogenase [Cecembia rubra]
MLSGKNIVITGAASGIGRELVILLHSKNNVIAVDMDGDRLGMLKGELPSIEVFQIDLLFPDAVEKVFEKVYKKWETIDYFFANAGFAKYDSWSNLDQQAFETIFRINAWVPFRTAQILKKSQIKPFRLVVTASAMAFWTVPGYSVYSASKAAIHQLAESIRTEEYSNWLTLVYPASTTTAFFSKAGKNVPQAFPVQQAENVAKAIIKGAIKGKKRVYPSFIFRSVLLINRLLPIIRPLYQFLENRKFQKWMGYTYK